MQGKILILGLIAGLCNPLAAYATTFIQRPEVVDFVDTVAIEHKIDKPAILYALSQIETNNEILQRMSKQYEALPWYKYKKLLVTEKRIQGGAKFWNEQENLLKKAQSKYGVPAELIVALIGVESSYGTNPGKFSVLQTLATLAFDYAPRADFFKNELKEYLLLITEQRRDPLELKGSYAGAMGMPQFIASSYRKYAVDFDKSGQIDLHNNVAHVIGSIANYLKEFGWQPNQDVVYKAKTNGDAFKKLPIATRNNPVPTLSLQTLKQHGITATDKIKNIKTNVALLEFNNGTENEYWLGLPNFYVITRYNNSSNYALAVHQLSLEIGKAHKKSKS